MGQLVKYHNGDLVIAQRYVATPTYTLRVADYAGGAVPPNGWEYHATEVDKVQFVLPWAQPTDATNAYPRDVYVLHNGLKWKSLVDGNVWEPGVSAWMDATTATPTWVQPTGAHDAYALGAHVSHASKVWESLVDANVWEPGVAEWREVLLVPPGLPAAYPEWIQPTGAGDAYPLGAHVMHNGHQWVSTVAANVWEPGVYGWTMES